MCNFPQPDRCEPSSLPAAFPALRDAVIAHEGQERFFDYTPCIPHSKDVAETLAELGSMAKVMSVAL